MCVKINHQPQHKDNNVPITKLQGLIAATYTPMHNNGELHLEQVAPMVEMLIESGVTGLYVCGSTGEGMSLTSQERRDVTEAYIAATNNRVPVLVQVGHNSLVEARELAAHAQASGAAAVSATCPSYFKVGNAESLIDCMAEVASGAPDTPFYYYHIPVLTGSTIDMVDFLQRGGDRIPNLYGLKYTDLALYEFQQCVELENGRFDVVWGCDEMLLGALATGSQAAIGSTFNIAAGLYQQIQTAFESGDVLEARRLQSLSVQMIRTIGKYPFHPAMKQVLGMLGQPSGPCRLPQAALSSDQVAELKNELTKIGFFDWRQAKPRETSSSAL